MRRQPNQPRPLSLQSQIFNSQSQPSDAHKTRVVPSCLYRETKSFSPILSPSFFIPGPSFHPRLSGVSTLFSLTPAPSAQSAQSAVQSPALRPLPQNPALSPFQIVNYQSPTPPTRSDPGRPHHKTPVVPRPYRETENSTSGFPSLGTRPRPSIPNFQFTIYNLQCPPPHPPPLALAPSFTPSPRGLTSGGTLPTLPDSLRHNGA